MTTGKRRKAGIQRLYIKTKTLDGLRDGYCKTEPCKQPITDGLSDLHRNLIFTAQVLHVPTEIDYLIAQTVEGMGYHQDEIRVAFYEGRHELQFEIFPPDTGA